MMWMTLYSLRPSQGHMGPIPVKPYRGGEGADKALLCTGAVPSSSDSGFAGPCQCCHQQGNLKLLLLYYELAYTEQLHSYLQVQVGLSFMFSTESYSCC